MASSATVSAPKKRKSFSEYFHSMRGQQLIVTLVFLFVPLVLLFMFTYLPFFKMVEFSFFKMKYIGRRTFVGLQNYISVFTRKDCFHALSLSLYYMVGSVVQMALALLFATILSFKCKGSKFFRGALYFPCLICGISVGFIFKFFFTHGFVLDTLLSWVGFNVDKLPFWLRDESINNVVLVACSIWKYIGQNIVMFIGAIASVDPVLYEAADRRCQRMAPLQGHHPALHQHHRGAEPHHLGVRRTVRLRDALCCHRRRLQHLHLLRGHGQDRPYRPEGGSCIRHGCGSAAAHRDRHLRPEGCGKMAGKPQQRRNQVKVRQNV